MIRENVRTCFSDISEPIVSYRPRPNDDLMKHFLEVGSFLHKCGK